MSLAEADRDCARALVDLVDRGILRVADGAAGRSASYELTP